MSKTPAALSESVPHDWVFKSPRGKPIRSLSLPQRGLFLAECCLLGYFSDSSCRTAAAKLGFPEVQSFSTGSNSARWLRNESDSVLVCCGRPIQQLQDLENYSRTALALAESVGRVHTNLKQSADELWPLIEKALEADDRTLWIAGHSISGALAGICAYRCTLSYIRTEPCELHTFGSPRLGSGDYVNFVNVPHFRWVLNNDPVPHLPPPWLGFRHSGQEMYLDRFGHLNQLKGWQRVSDRVAGMLSGLRTRKIDALADHALVSYIDAIFEAVRKEESLTSRSHP